MQTSIDWFAVALFILGPLTAVIALLVARRLDTRNWRYSLRGMLMLMTLVAVAMGAIAALSR